MSFKLIEGERQWKRKITHLAKTCQHQTFIIMINVTIQKKCHSCVNKTASKLSDMLSIRDTAKARGIEMQRMGKNIPEKCTQKQNVLLGVTF